MLRLKLYDVITDPFARAVGLHPWAVISVAVLVVALIVMIVLVLRRRRKGKK